MHLNYSAIALLFTELFIYFHLTTFWNGLTHACPSKPASLIYIYIIHIPLLIPNLLNYSSMTSRSSKRRGFWDGPKHKVSKVILYLYWHVTWTPWHTVFSKEVLFFFFLLSSSPCLLSTSTPEGLWGTAALHYFVLLCLEQFCSWFWTLDLYCSSAPCYTNKGLV